jgi:hypothetical protein
MSMFRLRPDEIIIAISKTQMNINNALNFYEVKGYSSNQESNGSKINSKLAVFCLNWI